MVVLLSVINASQLFPLTPAQRSAKLPLSLRNGDSLRTAGRGVDNHCSKGVFRSEQLQDTWPAEARKVTE